MGYLLKDRVSQVSQFVNALRRVAAGGTAMDPEVVAQMAEGRANAAIAAIAAILFVAEKAIGKQIYNVFRKLELTESADDNRRVLAVLAYLYW